MTKNVFTYCQGVDQGRQEVFDKIESLIEQLSIDITVEQDKRTSKAVFATVTTLRYSIECLKQLIGKD